MRDLPLFTRIAKELAHKREHSLLRVTPHSLAKGVIDFSSNSYCSLHTCGEIHAEALMLCDGDVAGNGSSRLIGVQSSMFTSLENELADWKHTEAALVFTGGYQTNCGIISALCTRDTVVFSDRLNHASIVDGIKLGGAHVQRYHHVDMSDLKNRLASCTAQEKIIITDTIFSMDGDAAPLADLCSLSHEFGALLMVDEAHATGVFGATLSGFVEACNCEDGVDIRMGTLSKALGGLGGFFCGTVLMREFLVNNARSLIYATALPSVVLAWNLAAIRYLRNHTALGRLLLEKSNAFKVSLEEAGFSTLNTISPIIPARMISDENAMKASAFLLSHNIRVPAIRPPTVPAGTARLRFSLQANTTQSDCDRALAALKAFVAQSRDRCDE